MQLVEWVRAAGGEVNVDIAEVNGIRSTVAAKDIKAGEVLAIIPNKLTYIAMRPADSTFAAGGNSTGQWTGSGQAVDRQR
jgi:hypothetical protein